MKPTVREFTKDAPCTKLEIYQCFSGPRGYQRVQVDAAHSVIGKSVPRVLERDGKAIKIAGPRGDFYELTEFGQQWLDKGIRAFLKNHPYKRDELEYPPSDSPPVRVRRARA